MTDEGKVTKKDAHDLHIGVQRKNKKQKWCDFSL